MSEPFTEAARPPDPEVFGKRQSTRAEAFERFAEFDLATALANAETTWPFPERIAIIRGTILNWSDTDIEACWEWIERSEARATAEEEGSGAWRGLLSSIYRERASGTPSAGEIARAWRGLERCLEAFWNDGGRALNPRDGVFEHPQTKKQAVSIQSVVVDARQWDDWAGTYLRLRKRPRINRPIPTLILHDWLAHDMDGALAWAAAQEDPALREEALTAMAARQSLGQGTEARINRAELLRQLMVIAPVIAIKELSKEDPREASEWLAESIDTLPNADSARVSLANALVDHDIEAALAWAGSIEAEHQRRATTNGVLGRWSDVEAWAAEARAKENLGWTDEDFARELKLDR